jgi:galacturan 1,4-alpha-galacturonidase
LRNFLRLAVLFSLAAVSDAALNKTGSACVATPLGGTSDDTPQIMDAFKQCGKGGSVAISEGTYNIGQVMDKLDFQNCDNHINGKLVWSADYWLSHSISVIYVGRSTARGSEAKMWPLGGTGRHS